MNTSARAIWELCDGTRTIEDICSELSDAAGVAPEELHDDVERAIERFDTLGLLTPSLG